jgi:hypothetical protein
LLGRANAHADLAIVAQYATSLALQLYPDDFIHDLEAEALYQALHDFAERTKKPPKH